MNYNGELVDLLRQLGLTVISSKKTEIYAICPWHNDKTPSLHINKEKMVYLCRAGCTKGPVSKLIKQLSGDFIVPDYILKRYTQSINIIEKNEFYDIPDYNYFNSLPQARDSSYLNYRNIPDSFIKEYDIRRTSKSVIFPVYSDNRFFQHYKCALTELEGRNFCGYVERFTHESGIRYLYSPGLNIGKHFFPNFFPKSKYYGIILTE